MSSRAANSTAALAREVRGAIEARADDATRRKYERLVPGARVIGVRVPELRALAVQLRRAHPDLTVDAACDLLDTFAAAPTREEMLVGVFLLARFGKAVEGIAWRRIAAWTRALDNWEACDQLAANVAARVVHAHPEHLASLMTLTSSRNRWARRFALATAADLTHAGRGSVVAALEICRVLLSDADAMIQTSIAWALREASKANAELVTEFLERFASKMPAKTVRDASAKLPVSVRDRLQPSRR